MDEQSCKCHCHDKPVSFPMQPASVTADLTTCEHCNPSYQPEEPNELRTRWFINMPLSLYDEITHMAQEQEMSESEFVRRCMKIGIMIANATQEADTRFIIRQGEREREIVFA